MGGRRGRSTRYFFELEKKEGENKMWNRIKNTEGKYKYDIDSIIDEQITFYYLPVFFQVQRNIELTFPLLPPILFLNEFLRLPLFVYNIS